MDAVTLRQYETLSPFEIKNDLAKVAAKTAKASQAAYLNAGRGNPNWVATEPRSAFFLLGQFAVTESQRTMQLPAGLGGMAKAPGIAARLAAWLETHADMPGAALLPQRHPVGGRRRSASTADAFVHELVDSILGDNYPVPDRMLVHNEQHRPRVPAVGDVRRSQASRHVRSLRGRRRHGRDVLHLQVAEGQPPAEPRRHHRAW